MGNVFSGNCFQRMDVSEDVFVYRWARKPGITVDFVTVD